VTWPGAEEEIVDYEGAGTYEYLWIAVGFHSYFDAEQNVDYKQRFMCVVRPWEGPVKG